jgi:hypothetical protein
LIGQATRGENHTAGFHLQAARSNLNAALAAFRIAQMPPIKGGK